jgi:hypothetical protein
MHELLVPASAVNGLKRRDFRRIQDALAIWIAAVGPTLAMSPIGRYMTSARNVTVADVPFPVSLYRRPGPGILGGRLEVVELVSGQNREQRRLSRIAKACNGKFPKLAAWKRDHGARTVLVLEENDIQLTNVALVADAVLDHVQSAMDRPDEIYLVSTFHDPWWLSPILVGAKTLFDIDGQYAWEVDPAPLTDLTRR